MPHCVGSDTMFLLIYSPLQQHILGCIWPREQYMVKEGSLQRDAELTAPVAAFAQAPLYKVNVSLE